MMETSFSYNCQGVYSSKASLRTVRLDHHYTRVEEEDEEMDIDVSQNIEFTYSYAPMPSHMSPASVAVVEPHYRPPRGRPSKTIMEKFLTLCFQGIKGVERDHWEVILEKETLSFVCKLCSRLFNNCYALKQHIRFVHMKIRPFPCGLCAKKFRSMYDLRRHGTTHTQERFACLHCGSDFVNRQRAYAHAREVCISADFASTLSEAYVEAKRRLGAQWERIQADNCLSGYVTGYLDNDRREEPTRGRGWSYSSGEPSTSSSTCEPIFPAEPIPVDIPDLW